MEAEYHISGLVRYRENRFRLDGVRVEILDSDPVSDDLLATVEPGAEGWFEHTIRQSDFDEGLDRGPDLIFRVLLGTDVLLSTSGHVMLNVPPGDVAVVLEIPLPTPGDPALTITSLADLRTNKAEILRRIRAMNLGEARFLADPFRCLADVGVALDAATKTAVLGLHPEIADLPAGRYDELKSGTSTIRNTIRLSGLFQTI